MQHTLGKRSPACAYTEPPRPVGFLNAVAGTAGVMMNWTHLLAATASAAFVLHPASAEDREQFRETVSIDYDTHNPCTGEKIRIKGDVIVNGWYQDVEDGYRFIGETDYTRLKASSRSS